ncbi:hypothetical protein MFRU_010g02390 [Monilinia fructicola]|nr:hypothetical protein MFRU_010g02390 [Monilinia fructicola]
MYLIARVVPRNQNPNTQPQKESISLLYTRFRAITPQPTMPYPSVQPSLHTRACMRGQVVGSSDPLPQIHLRAKSHSVAIVRRPSVGIRGERSLGEQWPVATGASEETRQIPIGFHVRHVTRGGLASLAAWHGMSKGENPLTSGDVRGPCDACGVILMMVE